MKFEISKLLKKKIYIKTNIFILKRFPNDIRIKENFILVAPKNIDKKILKNIKNKFNKQIVKIIFKPHGEPNSKMINKYLNSQLNAKLILAVGGGSTIDFAKALSIINPKKNIQYHEFGSKIKNSIPVSCIPTTCGSGSDVTQYAVINNSLTKRKFTIADDNIIPKNTYLCPDLLNIISKKYIFASLYDAFSHCLEVFFNKNEDTKIKKFSLIGIKLGLKILDKKINKKYFKNYMILALIGGLCILKSRTSIIHTLSVAVSKYYNLPHGLLNLYLTTIGIEFNQPYNNKDLLLVNNLLKNKSLISWIEKLENLNKKYYNLKFRKINSLDVITRISQDKGLKKVCYRRINKKNIDELIKKINEKNKKFL